MYLKSGAHICKIASKSGRQICKIASKSGGNICKISSISGDTSYKRYKKQMKEWCYFRLFLGREGGEVRREGRVRRKGERRKFQAVTGNRTHNQRTTGTKSTALTTRPPRRSGKNPSFWSYILQCCKIDSKSGEILAPDFDPILQNFVFAGRSLNRLWESFRHTKIGRCDEECVVYERQNCWLWF